jgi:hypothetical protein
MGDFVNLVETTIKKLREEEEVSVELSVEEQKQYFKGWMMAKASEDSTYLANNVEDIANDFKDDVSVCYGEGAITLDPAEFDAEIKDMNEKLSSSKESGDDEVLEPSVNDTEDSAEEESTEENTSW